MTVTTIGDWWAGTMLGLLCLAFASGSLLFAAYGREPSERAGRFLRRYWLSLTGQRGQLRRVRSRRTAAPGRHQAGTVFPGTVPAVFPGQDAALNAALTPRAATLLEDTATDLRAILPDTVTDMPAATRTDMPVISRPSGHYDPIADAIRRDRRDGNYVEWLPPQRVTPLVAAHFARRDEGEL